MENTKIEKITAIQIIDSRATPTIQTTVYLKNGAIGTAQVPSGASTGSHEAFEKRDDGDAWLGKGVLGACQSVNTDLHQLLHERDAKDQFAIDTLMCKEDGTNNKSRFGANAILSVSLATAKAVAASYNMPLYRYLGGHTARTLPIPLLNIVNGGAHADNLLDIQEFMICPHGAHTFGQSIRMALEIYGNLKMILKEDEFSVAVGDEGGFAPNFSCTEEALKYITRAIEFSGYQPGKDVSIALDIASSEWYHDGIYTLPKTRKQYTTQSLTAYYQSLVQNYPIISIEDPFHEDDFDAFANLRALLPSVQIVGDDLFTTNAARLKSGIQKRSADAILIKPNQIGTLSEALDAIDLAKKSGMSAILSHRSGDTADTSIADIAVGCTCNQIKSGAPARGERIAKYNRLLTIESELAGGGKMAVWKR